MKNNNIFKIHNAPLLFAHRGCSHAAPENTMTAFRLAREYGIPGIELDVRLCSTGEMVVFHDDDFKRIFNMEGSIEETSFKELQKLDAGIFKGEEFRGERIPLLSEVFELLGTDVIYDIEFKNRLTTTGPQEEALLKVIRKYNVEENCMVSSFNPFCIRTFKKLAPEISGAIIYSKSMDVPWYLRRGEGRYISGCPVIKPKWDMVTDGFIFRNYRLGGYPVLPWTVDDPQTAENLLAKGCAGIITNRPESMKHLFGL